MRDFIDEIVAEDDSIIVEGTQMDRAVMMGIQDFVGVNITFGNGKMTVNNDTGEKIEYTYNAEENSITKTMIGDKRLSIKLKATDNSIEGVIL